MDIQRTRNLQGMKALSAPVNVQDPAALAAIHNLQQVVGALMQEVAALETALSNLAQPNTAVRVDVLTPRFRVEGGQVKFFGRSLYFEPLQPVIASAEQPAGKIPLAQLGGGGGGTGGGGTTTITGGFTLHAVSWVV
jgi:hypothetical protein